MTIRLVSPIGEMIQRVIDQVLNAVLRDGQCAIVDSPPGAGKTFLIELLVATAVQYLHLRVALVTPTAEQSYELIRRLIANYGPMPIQVLLSGHRRLPPDLDGNPRILRCVSEVGGLAPGGGVVVGTVDKFRLAAAGFRVGEFDLLLCDESYQVTFAKFSPLFHIAHQVFLVGDPGQLRPLVRADIARFEAARFKIHWPVPQELLRRLSITKFQLPASQRLPQDTVDLVQPSFYPDLPFVSAARPDTRRIEYAAAGIGTSIDRALDQLGDGASVVGLVLPPTNLPVDKVDEELSLVMADVVRRLLDRGTRWSGSGALAPTDVGCVDAHVASGRALGRLLRSRGISTRDVMVEVPEIWQGLQRPLMVVKHPLSGKRNLDLFELEQGRISVMTSRHLLGCLVVGRDGILEILDQHRHNGASRALGAENVEWTGWQAHRQFWARLDQMGRLVRF